MKSLSKTIRIITFLCAIGCCLVYGCAPLQPLPPRPPPTTPDIVHPTDALKRHEILTRLHQQLEEWNGVPYRLGGLSKEGVDCSGFVHLTYLNQFNIRLPRSTYQQSRVGDQVFQNDLRAGDLIFFRIGLATRHVGIYLEKGQFVHASKSGGVKHSHLKNAYWSKRYWKAVRIQIDRP